MPRPIGLVKQAGLDFVDDDAMTLGAAVAFYAALSLAPLLVLFIWIAGLLGESTRQALIERIVNLAGEQAGQSINMVIQNAAEQPTLGSIAGVLSIAVLLFSASGIFAQLQAALNRIWDVEARSGQGVWGWVRKRLLALGLVLVIGLLLLASLALSAVASAALGRWALPENGVALAVFIVLFALMFRYLPDVKIAWRDVWLGAVATALLFTLGKYLIGLYLGRSTVGSAYGAAGSLIVLLVWVYYSALIFFFGAELTQVWARHSGRGIAPDEHAQAAT